MSTRWLQSWMCCSGMNCSSMGSYSLWPSWLRWLGRSVLQKVAHAGEEIQARGREKQKSAGSKDCSLEWMSVCLRDSAAGWLPCSSILTKSWVEVASAPSAWSTPFEGSGHMVVYWSVRCYVYIQVYSLSVSLWSEMKKSSLLFYPSTCLAFLRSNLRRWLDWSRNLNQAG